MNRCSGIIKNRIEQLRQCNKEILFIYVGLSVGLYICVSVGQSGSYSQKITSWTKQNKTEAIIKDDQLSGYNASGPQVTIIQSRNTSLHATTESIQIQNFLQNFRVQYSTVQYSTFKQITVQYISVDYSTVHLSKVQYSTFQYSKVQYSTVQ